MQTNSDIIKRFFEAIRYYMKTQNIRFFSNFCRQFNLPRTTLVRLEKEPHRQFHLHWLCIIVELGFSAHWLLTGEGEMIEK